MPLTRAEFETLTRDLLMRTRLTTQQVLAPGRADWDQVDRVLLVGGSTHMPMTGRDARANSPASEPDHSLAVSEVVARGAAVHAGIVAARAAADERPDADAAELARPTSSRSTSTPTASASRSSRARSGSTTS